jgi:hypothetical protein
MDAHHLNASNSDHKTPVPLEILISYQVQASRRLGYDTLMWQTPALSLTAQSFLFAAALSSNVTAAARLIAMSLALIISIISIQLMTKHRHHEKLDSLTLEIMEQQHGLLPLHRRSRERSSGAGLSENWFVRTSSFRVWILGLSLFGVAALGIIAVTILQMIGILHGSSPIFRL